MIVPLFTSAKKQAIDIMKTCHQNSQVERSHEVQSNVVIASHHLEEKGREEVRGHVAALMKCEAKYMEEKAMREDLEARMHVQDAYKSTLVPSLEKKLNFANSRLHDIQLDIDGVQDELAKEKAKRRTLEFSLEVLTSKYDALIQAPDLPKSKEDGEAQSCSLPDTVHQSGGRLNLELNATCTALAEMRTICAASSSSASVLQQQVSSLLVTVSVLRTERDELKQSLYAARQEASIAKVEVSAACIRLQDEQKRNKALEMKIQDTSVLLAAAERNAADARWLARDRFAEPKMQWAHTALDVELFEAQMERDLYRSQYEDEAATRASAEQERDDIAAQLEIAREEVERAKVEREEQNREKEDLRQRLGAAANAHIDALKKAAAEVVGLRARLEEAEPRRYQDVLDVKENDAPDQQHFETPSPSRADKIFKTGHQPQPFKFESEISSHSPVLLSDSFWGHSGMFKASHREFEDFVPWAASDVNRPNPEVPHIPVRNDGTAPPTSSAPLADSSDVLFYSPTLFRQLIAQDNAWFASQHDPSSNDTFILS